MKKNKKTIKKWIYILDILLIISSISFISYYFASNNESYKIPSYCFLFFSLIFIFISFILDFKNIMVNTETKGDEYTLMGKNALMKECQKRGLQVEENKSREYYLYFLRENNSKHSEENESLNNVDNKENNI
ncbi:MAG: hypothetical protein TYPL_4560 [Candidatus Tyloplasma litorale]|nr:MAG: hypothetical protein TYPL_4560 [Mycoplasmatales bacterium]